MQIEIEITDHLSRTRAHIRGQPGLWGDGRNKDEALGDLIRSHPEQFNITLIYTSKSVVPAAKELHREA